MLLDALSKSGVIVDPIRFYTYRYESYVQRWALCSNRPANA